MRIKYLSFIASFFMVSFVITSCLDDDNNIEYSPDATIHAFELDTTGLGKYKFTIDQLKSEIYNEDSLPVHADTIIDKILITKLARILSLRSQILLISESLSNLKYGQQKHWPALLLIKQENTRLVYEYISMIRIH